MDREREGTLLPEREPLLRGETSLFSVRDDALSRKRGTSSSPRRRASPSATCRFFRAKSRFSEPEEPLLPQEDATLRTGRAASSARRAASPNRKSPFFRPKTRFSEREESLLPREEPLLRTGRAA